MAASDTNKLVDVAVVRRDIGRPTRTVTLMVPGVVATCSRCGHEVRSYGQREQSVARCLRLMSEECPRSEHNFYVREDK